MKTGPSLTATGPFLREHGGLSIVYHAPKRGEVDPEVGGAVPVRVEGIGDPVGNFYT